MQDVVAAFILHSDASVCAARSLASVFPPVEVHKEDLCMFEVSGCEGTFARTTRWTSIWTYLTVVLCRKVTSGSELQSQRLCA